jgi:para-aminobenzoate synthetase component I
MMGTTAQTAVVLPLAPAPTVMDAVRRLCDFPNLLLLDSAANGSPFGRYSFLMADPFERWTINEPRYGRDPFTAVHQACQQYPSETLPGLPPFQGGAAGLLGYELGRCWERVAAASINDFQLPALVVGLYDWVIAWDHVQAEAWIISQGWPEREPSRRRDHAGRRAKAVWQRLQQPPSVHHALQHQGAPAKRLSRDELAPSFATPVDPQLWSNCSHADYLQRVGRVVEYIYAGDLFQANFTQRLLTPADIPTLDLYESLRSGNAAPFAGLMLHDDWAILSASPERFLQRTGETLSTRPIKGTRRRAAVPEADLFTKDELRESPKDLAENVMIVDLLRNDLSRVCRPGTVRVPELCTVETYATVQHLVSEIRGDLRADVTPWDALRATWPGGSISGAPKVRAMEVIAELEPTVRGPYTGSLFYVGFDGSLDSNLLIRTFVSRYGWLTCGVGGGIVAASQPQDEYAETWHKAAGMLQALNRCRSQRS